MKYPIGIQSFEKIRLGGYVYVDKTELIYQLANTGSYYFLGPPTPVRKSLLISTLEAYFSGQRELFEGLAIEKQEKDWTKYPILHLDLNTGKYDKKHSLANVLNDTLHFLGEFVWKLSKRSNPRTTLQGHYQTCRRKRPANAWSSCGRI